MAKKLRLILGDQLNYQHSWYSDINENTLYLIMELRQETDYVTHHIQKVIGFFAAMTEFSSFLKREGHDILYLQLNDAKNTGDLKQNIKSVISQNGIECFEYQLPDEYRLDEQLRELCSELGIATKSYDTEHFISSRTELGEIFKGKKMFLMETFYRIQRRKTGILMNGDEPHGGKWNFDHDNRNRYDNSVALPPKSSVNNNLSEIYERVIHSEIKYIGEIDSRNFIWPINRNQSLIVLKEFIDFRLPWFGTFQDALTDADDFMFHSKLSFALNTKMLHPIEVIRTVEKAYFEDSEKISLNQAEGFIRQILGWREYMRGIYWLKMPEYANLNFFNHERKLPDWFWTGETKMNCMSKAIGQSLRHAYAHHIQRLMVTGNFALLAGIHPDEVDSWYLGIYIDAIEWVEITNTRGMSQFADGGIVGTKPYASSANYIDKMGNYCQSCYYDKKEKTGEKACPFNSLYWHFYERHRDKLEKNPRIGMMYLTWDKMDDEKKAAILEKGDDLILKLNKL